MNIRNPDAQPQEGMPAFLKADAAASTSPAVFPAAPAATESPPKKPAVKSKLKAVDPKTVEASKPKILIFGKPGVQKTWVSLDFPSTYYMDTEGGADLTPYKAKLVKSGGMYFGIEQGSLSFQSVIEEIKTLATEKHHYKTLVIDSISKLFNVEVAKEADRLGDKNAFGADKKAAIAHMRQLVMWLTRLDMNVILIAHEKAEWGLVKGERAEIGSTFDCWDKLEYDLHLCLNIVKAGPASKARIRKSRLASFPTGEAFDWSYAEFAERYGKDVIEKESKALVLATLEQLAEVRSLLDVVKLPEGQPDKWLTAAGVTTFEEMDTDKIGKVISHLKAKTAPAQAA